MDKVGMGVTGKRLRDFFLGMMKNILEFDGDNCYC
jgi:hypothetical protein